MFAEKSDKLLKTESKKLKRGQKDIELGTRKWSFYNNETNKN